MIASFLKLPRVSSYPALPYMYAVHVRTRTLRMYGTAPAHVNMLGRLGARGGHPSVDLYAQHLNKNTRRGFAL